MRKPQYKRAILRLLDFIPFGRFPTSWPVGHGREAAFARRAPLFSAEKSTLSGQRASGRKSPDAGKREETSKAPPSPAAWRH